MCGIASIVPVIGKGVTGGAISLPYSFAPLGGDIIFAERTFNSGNPDATNVTANFTGGSAYLSGSTAQFGSSESDLTGSQYLLWVRVPATPPQT